MKKAIKILGMFMLTFFIISSVSSCSDDDDPVNNDFFAGTYKGSVSFVDGDTNISTSDGSVFVTKIASGTKYNFAFSNSIPDLNGVEFQQQGDHTLVMVGASATTYIRIDNNDLKILYIKDGKTWTANCTR
ncbi:hypothetical protein [Chryseobacterium sp. JUb7]|uniref:hypothetical protein n=1 Tax=Chryseobacterium sp. JUb7 TaxID=2940599 RepID=UPI0021695A04|nr:hypothetical protein [Chryseobacterium sp. JUb7]MCS3532460.1 hypothetical protein [Chryseobacterium sp. JUb7]